MRELEVLDLAQQIEKARALVKNRQISEALLAYEQLRHSYPSVALVHHGHANALLASGQLDQAVRGYDRALSIDAQLADAWHNRGCALQALTRHEEAIASFDRTLALTPVDVDARYNRANSIRALGRATEANVAFDEVLRVVPGHSEARANKAALLAELGSHDEALELLDGLISEAPEQARFHLNRGNVLLALKRHDEALLSFRAASDLAPKSIDALYGLGRALLGLGRGVEAATAFDTVVTASPNNGKAWANRGFALAAIGEYSAALASYDRATAIEPKLAQNHINKAAVLLDQRRLSAALSSYDQALAVEPLARDALTGRGTVLRELGRHEEAALSYDAALRAFPLDECGLDGRVKVAMDACDWAIAAQLGETIKSHRVKISPLMGVWLGLPSDQQLGLARAEAGRLPVNKNAVSGIRAAIRREENKRIKIGYLSSDFGNHAVGYQIVKLIERHDRARFNIVGFCARGEENTSIQRRIHAAFDVVEKIRDLGNAGVENLIRAHGIDILVDLNGYTTGNRLAVLAARPAPIQVTYIGFPGSLGTDFIDYCVADRIVLPEADLQHFAEQPVWMPECYQVGERADITPKLPTREAELLPSRGFVFASFNSAQKITLPIWKVWMRLLHSIQDSVLWLVASNTAARANLKQAAREHGIEENRLVFCSHVDLEAHLARQQLADLFLDTLPFCAHGTASQALRVGLPILTCRGNTFAGRVGTSLLTCLGMNDLIADDLAGYEERALQLAREPGLISKVKAQLRDAVQRSALFDTDRFARHLERAFEEMVEIHDRGEKPRPISVVAI